MMILGNDIHARLRKLRDVTERQLSDFMEVLEQYENPVARNTAASRSGTHRAVLH